MPELFESCETPLLPRLPSCLVPTSRLLAAEAPLSFRSSSVSAPISGRWNGTESWLRGQGVTLPAVIKAAWAVTLQCYVASEIACFEYHGPQEHESSGRSNGHANGNGAHSPAKASCSALCLLRLDESEDLLGFLRRMSSGRTSRSAFIPTRDEILFVSPVPGTRTWNTAVVFQDESRGRWDQSHKPQLAATVTVAKSSGGRLSTTMEYPAGLVGRELAASMLDTFGHVLAEMLSDPQQGPIRQVEACSPRDRQRIRAFTQHVAPAERSLVHDVIARQCRTSPGRTAICSWEGDMTYGELDDLSGRLARHLVMGFGVGAAPEEFVFSCFDKSMWAIVVRLAILRAGAAYVSVHAASPPGYLEAAVRRTRAKLFVTTPRYEDQFRRHADSVLAVTPELVRSLPRWEGGSADDGISAALEPAAVTPDSACLLLFTSGSTGEPKGIVQTHQSYATAIRSYADSLGLGPHTRFLQADDYSFDISNIELMAPLFVGGCCCVPRPALAQSPRGLEDSVRCLRANVAFLTPTFAIKIDPAAVPTLGLLCIGGELMPADLVARWAAAAKTTRLVNQYGMGEVAVCCTLNQDVRPDRCDNVGRPVTGAVWVVDPAEPGRLMPVGAVGELLIEGPHLSRRYLDSTSSSRRSEAVFVDHTPAWMAEIHPPDASSPTDRTSARLYRSGDLGRLLHDGTIQHLGRKDTMLKLDGCRVEALEVESKIRACLTPQDAVVVDLLGAIDGVADPVLTAYLYLHDHPCSTAPLPKGEPTMCDAETDQAAKAKLREIGQSIRDVLPIHMIPKRWYLVDWVIRTASGKTDRKKFHMVGQKVFMESRTNVASVS